MRGNGHGREGVEATASTPSRTSRPGAARAARSAGRMRRVRRPSVPHVDERSLRLCQLQVPAPAQAGGPAGRARAAGGLLWKSPPLRSYAGRFCEVRCPAPCSRGATPPSSRALARRPLATQQCQLNTRWRETDRIVSRSAERRYYSLMAPSDSTDLRPTWAPRFFVSLGTISNCTSDRSKNSVKSFLLFFATTQTNTVLQSLVNNSFVL